MSGTDQAVKLDFKSLGGMGLLMTDIPVELVKQLNQYIDHHVIQENRTMSDRLVGQLKRNVKSTQLEMDMSDGTGKMMHMKVIINHCICMGHRHLQGYLDLLTSRYHLKLQKDLQDTKYRLTIHLAILMAIHNWCGVSQILRTFFN